MATKLDRRGIRRLLALHPVYQLCGWFGISQPSFRRYMSGVEPKSIAVLEKINGEVERLLNTGRNEIDILKRYVNEWANHRVSVDESQRGVDCDYRVLRFAVGEVYSRYEVASGTLYVSKVHFLYWLGETCPDHRQIRERLKARGLMNQTRLNMNEGTGCPAATMDAYQFDLARDDMSEILTLLLKSAERDDPGQDGKIKERVRIGLTTLQTDRQPQETEPSQLLDASPVPAEPSHR
jgi:hypothetical protein